MFKKTAAVLATVTLLSFGLAGCGSSEKSDQAACNTLKSATEKMNKTFSGEMTDPSEITKVFSGISHMSDAFSEAAGQAKSDEFVDALTKISEKLSSVKDVVDSKDINKMGDVFTALAELKSQDEVLSKFCKLK